MQVSAAPDDRAPDRSQGRIIRLITFAIAGGTGFLVDAAVLKTLTLGVGLDPYTARAIAIFVATFATWAINRHFTFKGAKRTPGVFGLIGELARYFLVAAGSATVNWVIYALVLLAVPGIEPLIGLVIGSGTAMVVSYAGYSRFAFRHKH